jgi:hypothetical protein
MTDEVTFQLSQGYEVLQPKSGQAYPIPCDEWGWLKGKIKKLTMEPWLFHTLGSLFIGAALSALVAILVGTFQLPAQQRQLDITWAVVVVTFISGIVCLFFAHKERGIFRERANDIVAQMDLIETRYEHSSD